VPGRSQRQMVDQVAAAVMLQAWLDSHVAQSDS
jgi:RNase H-fold protein (predicted Holliday junction resolvase)